MTGPYVQQYEIRSLIGEGTHGTVYAAEHRLLRRRAALKIMHPTCHGDWRRLALFREDARAVRALRHPHIAEIIEVGRLPGGEPYTLTELIAGETLGDRQRRLKIMPLTDVLDFGIQAAITLGAAHQGGIVHRGLTREDFFLIPDLGMRRGERVKLADFAAARLRRPGGASDIPGDLPGSALYLAPEQLQPRRRVDYRADIYALGGLLYHALAGVPPFSADSRAALAAMHLHDTPAGLRSLNPDVPARVEAAILRALAKRPDDRFESMEGLARALRSAFASPVRRRSHLPAASTSMALAMLVLVLLSARAPMGAASSAARGARESSKPSHRGPSIVQLPDSAGRQARVTPAAKRRTARSGKRTIRQPAALLDSAVVDRDDLWGHRY
jgi:eukaryotic-like serine/threonine-protein kinase